MYREFVAHLDAGQHQRGLQRGGWSRWPHRLHLPLCDRNGAYGPEAQ